MAAENGIPEGMERLSHDEWNLATHIRIVCVSNDDGKDCGWQSSLVATEGRSIVNAEWNAHREGSRKIILDASGELTSILTHVDSLHYYRLG